MNYDIFFCKFELIVFLQYIIFIIILIFVIKDNFVLNSNKFIKYIKIYESNFYCYIHLLFYIIIYILLIIKNI